MINIVPADVISWLPCLLNLANIVEKMNVLVLSNVNSCQNFTNEDKRKRFSVTATLGIAHQEYMW